MLSYNLKRLKRPIVFFITFLFPIILFSQEILVTGDNGGIINDNSANSPSITNDTDFGTNTSRTFRIINTSPASGGSNLVGTISLTNTTDFTISPSSFDIKKNNFYQTFTITNRTTTCNVTSQVTITHNGNNDSASPTNKWIFTISARTPEINVLGNTISIVDGETATGTADNTDFGTTDVGVPITKTFTIQNTGNCTLTTGAFTFTGANASEFTLQTAPAATVAAGSSTTFQVKFLPSAGGVRNAMLSFVNNDSNENPYNFNIQGTAIAPLTEGPGGVTSNLKLWLKANEGITVNGSNGVTTWATQAYGSNATVHTAGQEPTFRDDAAFNVNFNPVVDFDNNYVTIPLDSDFSYDDINTQFLEGTSGFYSEEIFVVLIPDVTINSSFGGMDIFCADELPATNQTDATGIGLGSYSVRFNGEILSYAVGTTSSGNGYGVAEIGTGSTYDNVGIINTRNNTTATEQELYYNANNKRTYQNDPSDFSNVNDSRYWIGRSEGWEASTDARIAEIITYSTRKNDTDLTQERNRIQSYLAIKYGITLGVNGTSQDYVDSNGTVIWDQSENNGFNYDIAGIGRDDISELNQKQSKSVNTFFDGIGESRGLLTIGLSDIYDTNNLNTSTFNTNKQFLVWGNNNASLDGAALSIEVDMSIGISDPTIETKVSFEAIPRIWKVKENGGDIPKVKVSIPVNAVRTAAPPNGKYLMFISDTGIFDPNADYRVMTESGGNLYTEYDFDGTKYITFGWAPEKEYKRSIFFDPSKKNYIDMEDNLDLNSSEFTISAWIKRGASSANTSILSKRNVGYAEGYDFKIDGSGKLEMSWGALGVQKITSNTTIPQGVWHQAAIIYSGNTAKLYIDGVLDKTVSGLTNPSNTSSSFFIAAACKNTPEAYFHGNIDEVRIWDIALSVEQLRYIMNQEIEENLTFVGGKIVPNTITKNEVTAIPWNDLAGYYPMSVYTYTNTKDASGKGHQGALRNLNTVDKQTAPLPYISSGNTSWDISATWENGNSQTIPGAVSSVDNITTVDWNIVQIKSNVTIDNSNSSIIPLSKNSNRCILGLIIDDTFKLTAAGTTDISTGDDITGNGITISHYLKLNGKIDLEGGSQLIQTEQSDLDAGLNGEIERDQQGTASSYNYNYWSSSVWPKANSIKNANFKVKDVLFDGSNPASPGTVIFKPAHTAADSRPANSVDPITISSYWIYKFYGPNSDYNSWFPRINELSDIKPGEGYTMKGTSGKRPLTEYQNYTFKGKPYNGDILLELNKSTGDVDRLIGNPYASAMDADLFIKDNLSIANGGTNTTGNIFNGAIYYWHHFSGATHLLAEYVGGYATYSLMGGAEAVSTDARIKANGDHGLKFPEKYIPVNQGFFVVTALNPALTGIATVSGGNIVFKNKHRVFKKEGSSGTTGSLFFKSNTASKTSNNTANKTDDRAKIRLEYVSPLGYHRKLLVGVDKNTTNNFDIGYDAPFADVAKEDMYWIINNSKFVIQGVNNFNDDQELPLGIIVNKEGIIKIQISNLENVDPSTEISIKDNSTGTLYKINNTPFEIELPAGEYKDRFSLVFKPSIALNVEEEILEAGIRVFMNNTTSELQIINTIDLELLSVNVFNYLGQKISSWNSKQLTYDRLSLPVKSSTGVYFVQIKTNTGELNKKIIIK